MILKTTSDLPYSQPLRHTHPHESLENIQVGMAALVRGLLHVRGYDGEAVLSRAYALPILNVGDVAVVDGGLAVRLRRDEFLLVVEDVHVAMAHVEKAAAGARITLTDVTHGRAGIALVGERARHVLAKVCALDFSDRAFPSRHAAQTSLAKVRALIIRDDLDAIPAYQLYVDRSLAAYVWDVVRDATQEFE